jgi:hypothetical protein
MTESGAGVLARFDTMQDAADAITTLENHGIDGADLALTGEQADRASHAHGIEVADRRIARRVVRLVAKGAILGAIGGAIVSTVIVAIASLFLEGVRDHLLAQVMVVVAFAFLGAIAGTFATVERGLGFSESWQLAFHDVPEGETWLAVLGSHDDIVDTLQEAGATKVVVPRPTPLRTTGEPHPAS